MDEVEQYSAESANLVRKTAAHLAAMIEGYSEHVTAMRGGSSEVQALHARNKELRQAVVDFNQRISDHTGTWPLPFDLEPWDDDELDEDEPAAEPGVYGHVSIVSRWDVLITDPAQLVAAGRAAHRRNRPEETEEDAAVAIDGFTSALSAITHGAGEAWFDVPGLEVGNGARIYVEAPEPPASLPDDPELLVDWLAPPAGLVTFSEAWMVGPAPGPEE